MNKIPTAREIFEKHQAKYETSKPHISPMHIDAAIEFAQLHVEAALKAVRKNIKLCIDKGEGFDGKEEFEFVNSYVTEEDYLIYPETATILSAYNLNNIK